MGKTLQKAIYPQWASMPIGYAFPIDDSDPNTEAPPADHPEFTFIKLTADQDGVGEYNEGKLTNETISGTAPLIEATAEISASGSPVSGRVVNLVNTEGRHIAPGESAGTVHDDQMQQITGDLSAQLSNFSNSDSTGTGVFADNSTRGSERQDGTVGDYLDNEANRRGMTVGELADEIEATRTQWVKANAKLEAERVGGKQDVRKQTKKADVENTAHYCVNTIEGISL